MKHSERLKLAEEISKKIVKSQGKNILSIGIFGSVARNKDNDFSDLELIIITKKKGFFNQYILKDIIVLELSVTFKNALKMIKNVDEEWSLKPGYLIHQKIIYGDKSIINKFKKEINLIKNNDLKKAAEKLIIWMYDNLNKIRSANRINNRKKMLVPLSFYTIHANLLVGLMNKYIFERQYYEALDEAKSLKKLPKNYYNLMNILYNNNDITITSKTAIELHNNCLEFLKK